jgi:hypothetical protein
MRIGAPSLEEPMRYSLDDVPVHDLLPGFHGRFIHTEGITLVYWHIEAGAAIPPIPTPTSRW